jgi:hypothetical protein
MVERPAAVLPAGSNSFRSIASLFRALICEHWNGRRFLFNAKLARRKSNAQSNFDSDGHSAVAGWLVHEWV